MTTGNKPIDQLFKEKLGNFEKNPPAALFAQIEATMEARSHARRINRLRTVISIAASLLLLLMAGWFATDQSSFTENKQPVVNPPQRITAPAGSEQVAAAINKVSAPSPAVGQSGTGIRPALAYTPASRTHVSGRNRSAAATSKDNTIALQEAVKKEVGSPVDPSKTESTAKNETPAINRQKEAGMFQNQNPSKNRENQYYSANPGANVPEKKSASLRQWSLKAEIAQTFTAMQVGSGAMVDSKSINSMGGGMIASLQLTDKLTISTGIRFSQMKQGSHSNYTLAKTSGITYLQPIEKSGNITRDISLYIPAVSSIVYSSGMATNAQNIFVSDLVQEFQYLEVPIQAGYKLLDRNKLSVGITGGISSNFLVGNFASLTENGLKLSQGSTDNIQNVLYSGSAGFELGYDLGKNLVLTIEPRVKQYLHSVSSNDLVNIKPVQMGIFTGITYSFQ